MKYCAIICEFNPLTRGHEHIIAEAKRLTGKNIIALMSGGFVQRGEMAIINKYARARLAIGAGCDFVFELPAAFAISPAQNFASGAIKVLKELGAVTDLCFGTECGTIEPLISIARLLVDAPRDFRRRMKARLSRGENAHFAQMEELSAALPNIDVKTIMSGANNILAIEYLKAIFQQNANITPHAILRTDNGYTSATPRANFLGATQIRKNVNKGDFKSIENFVSAECLTALKQAPKVDQTGLNNLILYTLRTTPASQLKKLFDVTEGLENLLQNAAKSSITLDEAIKKCVCKRYREARIRRLTLYAALDLTKSLAKKIAAESACVKLLATKRENKPLLSSFTSRATVIITNADYNAAQSASLIFDQKAANLYAAFSSAPHAQDRTTGTLFL